MFVGVIQPAALPSKGIGGIGIGPGSLAVALQPQPSMAKREALEYRHGNTQREQALNCYNLCQAHGFLHLGLVAVMGLVQGDACGGWWRIFHSIQEKQAKK